jgi:hypothetical protein
MAEPTVRRTPSADQSIGDLVSVAARDISQLVRYELDLAKLELKADAKKIGIGAALGVVGAFALCLVLMVLCFAFAYGLHALGIWLWASFLIVAGTCVLIFLIAALVAFLLIKRVRGLPKTRRSIADGASLLHRRKPAKAAQTTVKAG